MKINDTFTAIATSAMNPGSIGIVRISGPESFSIIRKIFRPKHSKRFERMESHTIHYGHIVEDGQVIDEVMILLMRGPMSFTAEDTVEIDCHGGILVTRNILETVLRAGARAAEPGEFTKHAFLNGRIDLAEAEAVMEVIQAKNSFALQASVSQLQGSVSQVIHKLRDEILDRIAFIEAALDDPEHISLEGYTEELSVGIKSMQEQIKHLIATADDGILLKEGIKTVILGKPNAGKSSLMNLLLGKDRAIVTEIAGTTRDTLSEQIHLKGIGFELLDTAGIRETEDVVERIGVERSIQEADKADLILYVVDASEPLDENDRKILSLIREKRTVIIYNKVDLDVKLALEDVEKLCPDIPIMCMSAREGTGLEQLKECLYSMFLNGALAYNDEVVITSVRHKNALIQAQKSLDGVIGAIEENMPEDFLTIDLTDAYEALGQITGESIEDDVADRIFEKFCMGK